MNADVRWRGYAAYSLWSGILVLILFVIVGFFALDNGAPLHEWTGLIQRVLVAVWLAWMIVLALAVRADA
jgi:cytochrome b